VVWLSLHLARKMRVGLVVPYFHHVLNSKKKLLINFSMFNKLENFNKFTKLSKDFGELDNKLITQHFHHIHICTLTYTMYSSNFSTFKNT